MEVLEKAFELLRDDKEFKCIIKFREPALQLDPKKVEYTVDYLMSDIAVEVIDADTGELEFEDLKLKDFNVSRVLNVIKKAGWI